jgi:hypothetical protein
LTFQSLRLSDEGYTRKFDIYVFYYIMISYDQR